jgi:UDP-N-acetylglucosamine:LPS N-acetylglucosamine transferase
LEAAIREASLVISRCGYSTVMDLVALQKKSILIPTPGQTEQEYLAQHLTEKALAFCVPQDGLDIVTAMALAQEFVYHFPEFETGNALQKAISQLLVHVNNCKEAV